MFPSGVATTYNDGVLESGFSGSGMVEFMAMDAIPGRQLMKTFE
ncbi:hypothetical protein M622_03790 [Thauera terpenica 58Eu]|jgi:hypothetical protein|uniref:Uncharacterized protein n=1 Tax=Thauera terpenica 58Eu TaxID=1348657 RepID=T0AXF0_9RHOO|nr:hypothetical protein M622_03790 [Thauera terpenica 58Eu]